MPSFGLNQEIIIHKHRGIVTYLKGKHKVHKNNNKKKKGIFADAKMKTKQKNNIWNKKQRKEWIWINLKQETIEIHKEPASSSISTISIDLLSWGLYKKGGLTTFSPPKP